MDLRTITLGVPPQEVILSTNIIPSLPAACSRHVIVINMSGADQGQRDGECGRGGVLQGQQRHRQCGQR